MVNNSKGVEFIIHGIVQGVGFRPFIYRLAQEIGLTGTVSNSSKGVVVRIHCGPEQLDCFQTALTTQAPPLAKITSIEQRILDDYPPRQDFAIDVSESGPVSSALIPPDIAICRDCSRELTDPDDRRYLYPFINCTNCGPRFSIVETIPYDRPKTSMKQFPMCASCGAEYGDPADRRFHAQPNSCFACGPSLSYHDKKGVSAVAGDPIAATVQALNRGDVVAIRGLGGFHLAVDGTCETAVANLRARKSRPAKPLAIMMADINQLGEITEVNPLERELLTGPQHPIVLLPKPDSALLAGNLAPGISEIGVMLPYTPFHKLLFHHPDCPKILVMTSGNISGEPICTSNECAFDKLTGIADAFLLHNRDIVTRIDDSVARVIHNEVMLMRRARGYVPAPIILKDSLPPVLGCGGGLKSTFCLAKGHFAILSQHIGDLFNIESFEFYSESVDHLKKVLEIEPELVACDLHPDYLSSHFAQELGLPLYRVQHHHAHAVAVMTEHALTNQVLAVVLDGTGYGTDGTIWGGEFLLCDQAYFKRMGHLQPLPLPGGDAAASEPYRMALAALFATFGPDGLKKKNLPPSLSAIDPSRIQLIGEMLLHNFNCPMTSSCGRLFDGVAALLGVRQVISFEGQAAMGLEAIAQAALKNSPQSLSELLSSCDKDQAPVEKNEAIQIASHHFIGSVVEALHLGRPVQEIALHFHLQLINTITQHVHMFSRQTGVKDIVLSGGCMQNRLLLEGLFLSLKQKELKVYTGSEVPVNDGGISLGQVTIGGLQHVSSHSHAGY